MQDFNIEITLSYEGSSSDAHEIDLYDVSQALIGFQRSLALTTHLVLHGEIITQAPSLKGAEIFAFPAEEGSWKMKAGIAVTAAATFLGTAENNSVAGHLIFSAYDYVISQSLGFHVDYSKSLGQQYEDHQKKLAEQSKEKSKTLHLPEVRESQLDSLIEKCATAVKEIHRPIYKTNTADTARISVTVGGKEVPFNPVFSLETYDYLVEERLQTEVEIIEGYVSSYNGNTYKGRIYVAKEERSISFELDDRSKTASCIKLLVNSLSANALRKFDVESDKVFCKVYKVTSKLEHLKKYIVIDISSTKFD